MWIRWAAMLVLMLAAASGPAPAQWGDAGPTLIFFDWGKGELSGDSKASLDKVAAAYRAEPRPMTIDGHSDRSGAAASNLASSRRRAGTVRDYLAGLGVPASAIMVRAYGESWPIIATADGVREVQNRRVEIRWGGAANRGASD
ncbi:MAG: OmpA family protein [Sphingomonas bacterium]|nr:OmpA family protein [Sphingomonas bacterium]